MDIVTAYVLGLYRCHGQTDTDTDTPLCAGVLHCDTVVGEVMAGRQECRKRLQTDAEECSEGAAAAWRVDSE